MKEEHNSLDCYGKCDICSNTFEIKNPNNQRIGWNWQEEFDKKYPPTPSSPQFLQFREDLKSFIENLLQQERQRMSDALTVNLDTSVMLDGWEKYWIDAKNGRYIEGCVECGNSNRINVALGNDHKCGGELCIVCGYRKKIKKAK